MTDDYRNDCDYDSDDDGKYDNDDDDDESDDGKYDYDDDYKND